MVELKFEVASMWSIKIKKIYSKSSVREEIRGSFSSAWCTLSHFLHSKRDERTSEGEKEKEIIVKKKVQTGCSWEEPIGQTCTPETGARREKNRSKNETYDSILSSICVERQHGSFFIVAPSAPLATLLSSSLRSLESQTYICIHLFHFKCKKCM